MDKQTIINFCNKNNFDGLHKMLLSELRNLKRVKVAEIHENLLSVHVSEVENIISLLTTEKIIESQATADLSDDCDDNLCSLPTFLLEKFNYSETETATKNTIFLCVEMINQFIEYQNSSPESHEKIPKIVVTTHTTRKASHSFFNENQPLIREDNGSCCTSGCILF